ncbi:MAG: M23 family metallopeptidase [Pseudaminobacter sp.]|nr:M23 family metallopeptidase [Pseudaminobacter sp.]
MQHAYEDRISALRAQVDRITSRQLLDQQLMETKVTELIQRQSQLSQRHGRLGPLLERASAPAQTLPAAAPAPSAKPDIRAGLIDMPALRATPELALAGFAPKAPEPFSLWSTRTDSGQGESPADHADKLFVAINQSLRSIETEQLARIDTLSQNAYQTADAISGMLRDAGLPVDDNFGKGDVGGPLVAMNSPMGFDTRVKELDEALSVLDRMKMEARRLPISNPAPGRSISSTFGVRKDPILGTPALHSGMDFRAPVGLPALATAAGKIVKAGWNGGYGRMVEIDHGGGLTTRYAHLSKIEVKEGQSVAGGDIVGKVGSSGRSTGPHLHYEIRRHGDAIDPLRFLKLGKKVRPFL